MLSAAFSGLTLLFRIKMYPQEIDDRENAIYTHSSTTFQHKTITNSEKSALSGAKPPLSGTAPPVSTHSAS